MEYIRHIIADFPYKLGKTKMDQLYGQLKVVLANKIDSYMNSKIAYKTKPRKDINSFVEAFYGMLDQGGKYKNLKATYGISAGSFCNYIKLCDQSKILTETHYDIINEYQSVLSNDKITDTFTLRAKEGTECKGYHHKEKSKKGTSVSLIIETNKIPLACYVDSASIDDREMLWNTLPDPDAKSITLHRMFADKGYVGNNFRNIGLDRKVQLVCPPKTTRGGGKTHTLSSNDVNDLKKYRNKIEHVNSIYRNFRSVDVRYVKRIRTFNCFIHLVTILVTIMQLKNKLQNTSDLCS